MRIAFVVTSFPNPASTPILKQITALMDRGHEVDVYGDRQGDLSAPHADIDTYKLFNRIHHPRMPSSPWQRFCGGMSMLGKRIWNDPGTCLRSLNVAKYGEMAYGFTLLYAAQTLNHEKPYDVIHAQFGPNGIKAMFLKECRLLKGPLLTTFRGYDLTAYPRRRGGAVYRGLFRAGNYFTANSAFLAQRAMELGCPEDKIEVLPTGINLNRFKHTARRVGPEQEIVVLSVGRLVEVKGIRFGLQAMAEIIREFPQVQYDIVGDGPLRSSLQQLAVELGIANRVRFLGAQSEEQLISIYRDSHLFLFPGVVSRQGDEEGFGGVCVEAQASGMPVVATEVGGIRETVANGQSGVLVQPRNVTLLVDALRDLLHHPERWPAMGSAGRTHVTNRFDLETASDRLLRIYRRLARGRNQV
ncbi:MAG: glycosyltransferase [Planctomycetota bacterium]